MSSVVEANGFVDTASSLFSAGNILHFTDRGVVYFKDSGNANVNNKLSYMARLVDDFVSAAIKTGEGFPFFQGLEICMDETESLASFACLKHPCLYFNPGFLIDWSDFPEEIKNKFEIMRMCNYMESNFAFREICFFVMSFFGLSFRKCDLLFCQNLFFSIHAFFLSNFLERFKKFTVGHELGHLVQMIDQTIHKMQPHEKEFDADRLSLEVLRDLQGAFVMMALPFFPAVRVHFPVESESHPHPRRRFEALVEFYEANIKPHLNPALPLSAPASTAGAAESEEPRQSRTASNG